MARCSSSSTSSPEPPRRPTAWHTYPFGFSDISMINNVLGSNVRLKNTDSPPGEISRSAHNQPVSASSVVEADMR
jgi:hypothetical protein